MKKISYLVLTILLVACSGNTENDGPNFEGSWKAKWNMLQTAYPDITDMSFTMNGNFIFQGDSLTVQANGYEGCIFHADTLSHTQNWFVRNDSLFLQNEPGVTGMTYQIISIESNKVELQLLEDIFVTLTK